MESSTVLDVLQTTLRHAPERAQLELKLVPPAPNLQERIGPDVAPQLLETARSMSHDEGIPFWHSVFRIAAQDVGGVPAPILSAALYNQSTQQYVELGNEGTLREDMSAALEAAPVDSYVVMSSRVRSDEGTLHVPLLDFSVKERWEGSIPTVLGAVRVMGVSGTVLASGRSFHFIGDALLTWDAYAQYLYRALLLAPLVDERWIAHQLMAGEATLRVSENSAGQVPQIIDYMAC